MNARISLAVQRLGLCAFTAEGPGSILGWGTKIPQATRCSQKTKKERHTGGNTHVRQRSSEPEGENSSAIFWNIVRRISVNSSLNVW